MDVDDVRRLVEGAAVPSHRKWAGKHGLSQQYVSMVINGEREPGPSILNAVGLERVVSYRRPIPKQSLPKPTSTEKE